MKIRRGVTGTVSVQDTTVVWDVGWERCWRSFVTYLTFGLATRRLWWQSARVGGRIPVGAAMSPRDFVLSASGVGVLSDATIDPVEQSRSRSWHDDVALVGVRRNFSVIAYVMPVPVDETHGNPPFGGYNGEARMDATKDMSGRPVREGREHEKGCCYRAD